MIVKTPLQEFEAAWEFFYVYSKQKADYFLKHCIYQKNNCSTNWNLSSRIKKISHSIN